AGKCGRLNKTLYGLKQRAREWFEALAGFLKSIGITQIHADVSVFHKYDMFILIYVDDILILAKEPTDLTLLLKEFDYSSEWMYSASQTAYSSTSKLISGTRYTVLDYKMPNPSPPHTTPKKSSNRTLELQHRTK